MSADTPPRADRGSPTVPIVAFLLVAAVAWIAIASIQPPPAAPPDAAPDRFSAGRALEILREIARAPHPTGSAENARVREVVVTRLRSLGLAPEIQTATGSFAEPWWGPSYSAATVRNVAARITGTGGARAVMLAAHYDSVPSGPGAGDDGCGVATVLEAARALTAGPRLRNDVILLITDGEELGLSGAQAFVSRNPWAREVGAVVNFEARGTAGPSLMYETTPGNRWLIRELARSRLRVNASSLFAEASRQMKNSDSDLSAFRSGGLPGLNFAFIDDGARYHTVHDDLADVDPASLQQHGDAALALARRFGGADLGKKGTGDAVYFSVFGAVLAYPESWAMPLAGLAVLLTVLVGGLGVAAGRLSVGGMAVGALGYAVASAVAAGACELAWRGLQRAGAVPFGSYGMAYNVHQYGAAFIATTIAVFTLLYAIARGCVRRENVIFGGVVWWLVLTVAATLRFVGGSYLVLLPLVAALLTLAFEFLRPPPSPRVQVVAWAPATVVTLLLAGAAPYLLLMLVADTMLLATVPVVMILGMLLPQLHVIQSRWRWALPGVAAVVAVVAFAAAASRRGYDADHPRGDSLFYALDADTGKAAWASRNGAPDEWTSRVLAGAKPGSLAEYGPFALPYLHAEAPAITAVPPQLRILDDSSAGGLRTLRMGIVPGPGTRIVWVAAPGTEVVRGTVNGTPLPEPNTAEKRRDWQLRYTAPPPEGVELTLVMRVVGAPSLLVTDVADGLPEIGDAALGPRPAWLMASPSVTFDSSTLVTKSFPLR